MSSEAAYLATARAVRERAEQLYGLGLGGQLLHFEIDEAALPRVVERVLAVLRRNHATLADIPYHARWRHFAAGGVDRAGELERRLGALDADERLRARFELAITSVLLDAGAGAAWGYLEGSQRFSRSEGLAVASYHLFSQGKLSSTPERAPLRADAEVLSSFEDTDLARAFQAGPDNPLVGVSGRTLLLRQLGDVVRTKPEYFGSSRPRLGEIGLYLAGRAQQGNLPARLILETLLDALAEIWPGRMQLQGKNLGDVWEHPAVGWVPLHKLSQWLAYSLCEPLEHGGIKIVDLDALTGLAEYRNGGLFLDTGVLVPKTAEILAETHAVSSTVVVEWRALTIALLDRVATAMRGALGAAPEQLPLAKVLEAGTWRAGRELAFELRSDGSPPLRILSDGTVF
jgi:hypothetical protein